jgi:hypothetical protein
VKGPLNHARPDAILGLMDVRDRLLGPVASITNRERDELAVDFGDLIRKLILSDRFILESNRLREIPLLVQKFGYDGVAELLHSGRMQILRDALSVGSIGHISEDLRPGKAPLPLGSYSFGMVRLQSTRETVHADLQPIDAIPGLRGRQAQRLRRLVAERIAELPDTRGGRAIDAFKRDLELNAPILRTSVALALRQEYGRSVNPNDFELRVERVDEHDWRTETNLGTQARLSDERVHKVVERGLLGAGGLKCSARVHGNLQRSDRIQSQLRKHHGRWRARRSCTPVMSGSAPRRRE